MAVRPLRAPQEDGAFIAEPSLPEAGRLLQTNRRLLDAHGPDLLGRPWSELRAAARQAALAAARDYLRGAGEPLPAAEGDSLLMAGHQPELFHPGVWVKNFALHGLARSHGGVSLNLVVDNDTVKGVALRLPDVPVPLPATRDFEARLVSVPFDRWTAEVPYEERTVQEEDLFASLPQRARRPWGFEPLLPAFWQEALRQAERTPLLGERIAAARRALERRWGCHNLEVPVSRLCQTEPYAWFAVHLLANLPRLHAVYNTCVQDYRRRHGLRSKNHPVPELAAEGDWLEAPFWAWRSGSARRSRPMARVGPEAIELRVGGERWPALPAEPRAMVAAWLELERGGFKVRSRALTNTLYARLFLCDLFVHGIGGGKYDEVTDAIVRRFYGVEPPTYLVLSATLRLPLPTYPARPDDARRLRQLLRDLYYNPQRHLEDGALSDAALDELLGRKRTLIREVPEGPGARRERFHQLREVTERLRVPVSGRLAGLREELAECERQLRANEVLRRRDYAFCLYPEQALRPFCTRFLTL